MDKENQYLVNAIREYIKEYVPTVKTSSENTVKSDTSSMNSYLHYLETEKGYTVQSLCRGCFSKEMLEEWMQYMHEEKGLSEGTCNDRLSAIRMFLKYLSNNNPEYTDLYQDALQIPALKAEKKHPQFLTEDAVMAILAEADTNTSAGRRDVVFIRMAYETAGIISELLSVRIEDLRLKEEQPQIILSNSEGKKRLVYIDPDTADLIDRYISEAHGDHPDSYSYLFNTGRMEERLTKQAINNRLRMYAEKARQNNKNVPENLQSSQFRFTRGRIWLEEKIRIAQISQWMGHARIYTTINSLDLSKEERIRVMKELKRERKEKAKKIKDPNSLSDLTR